ncbi:hypothetical protein TNCV_627411 [Trichonephila clavipes]|nr:hypothetical protein TNCV_627411 [Trichonephila clavipes]
MLEANKMLKNISNFLQIEDSEMVLPRPNSGNNKNVTRQHTRSFFSTRKERKISSHLSKPSFEESNNIRKALIDDDVTIPESDHQAYCLQSQEGFEPKTIGLKVQWAICNRSSQWYRYRTVACLVTSSSPVPLKTRRFPQPEKKLNVIDDSKRIFDIYHLVISRHVEVLLHVKSIEAQTSSHWCGVEVKTGVPAQVSSSSLDHGSKLRGPSPKVLV